MGWDVGQRRRSPRSATGDDAEAGRAPRVAKRGLNLPSESRAETPERRAVLQGERFFEDIHVHLVEDQPAEEDRDDRVHVRVRGDARDRRVLEQPRVGGEREPRAE